MAVLFGDVRPDGKIRVWRTQHIMPVEPGSETTREITVEDTPLYPDGWWFESLPEYPDPEIGKDHIWLFDPKTGAHLFETNERPLNSDEQARIKTAEITIEASKTAIQANGADVTIITATIPYSEILGLSAAYFVVNGQPMVAENIVNGKTDIEITTETVGLFKVDVLAGNKQASIIIEGV